LRAVLDAEGQVTPEASPSERTEPAELAASDEAAGAPPPPEWLRQVPTELLFHALKSRAGSEDGPPPPRP